ncbi:MAG: DNA recombination protein RmuC [Candidatus Pacebacteria bacterium]|nr:DNA recombination protein RmuC [Candidatus Paceibacterota bacterium]
MEYYLFLILIVFFVILIGVFLFLRKKVNILTKKMLEKKDDQSFLMLQNQLQKILETNQDLKISNEKLKRELSEKLSEKLNESQKSMSASTEFQFKESQRLIRDVTRELGEVKKSSEQVIGFTEQLKNLQDILQNSKQRGALGEYFLEQTIENILPSENYEFQYSFKDGSIVDAVIKFPDGLVSIDSKFSLENYNKFISEKDKEIKKEYQRMFKEDLKKRIIETAKYIKPKEGTMDFAFMFIPSEGIYYDLLISRIGTVDSKNFLEYAFRDKRVIVVSPTTLHAYLQTVMQGLRSIKIEKQAGQIVKKVENLDKHLKSFKIYHDKLGNSIGTVYNHYNSSQKEFAKINKDVIRITGKEEKLDFELLDKNEKNGTI